jgi:outer membrane biosynthesis protein TonB
MTQDDLDRLIHRHFEGGLSPAEERQLWHLIRTEKTAADRFVELSELESAMVESLQAEESVPPEVSLPGRSARRATRVLPTAPRTRRTVWPLFLAAGLMLGFLALLISSASKTDPAPVVHRPELPLPKEPKPEPAPQPAPYQPVKPLLPVPEKKAPETPEPKPVDAPKPPDPTPEPPKPEPKTEPAKTVVAAETKAPEAIIRKIEGDVVDDAGALAKVGPLASGLEVRGAKASAVVELADGTQVELRPDTKLERVVVTADQKRFVLARGTAVSNVAKQVGRSVVFQTPHAEVTVIGTKLSVEVGRESTRVEVQEGRVRCKRLPDGPSVEIGAGKFAVAGKGLPLAVKPVLVVRAFQDGPDYKGTRDTWISFAEPTQNFATGDMLRLRKLSGALTALISWDISSIPAGSKVVSAELTWWVTGKLVGPVQVYHLRVPFEESEATWKTPGGGKSWFVQGAQSDGDRGTTPIATLEPAKTGFSTIAVNDIRSIQEWINDRKAHYGILVAGPEANEWNLDSRESAVPDRRPKLTITYIPPAK